MYHFMLRQERKPGYTWDAKTYCSRSRKKKDIPAGNVAEFQKYLEGYHMNATLRREMGTDIMAACGQLRRGLESEANKPKDGDIES